MSTVELPNINEFMNTGNKSNSSLKRNQDKDQQRFLKLAQLKSVEKFIKSNDLSSVIGNDNYYPKQLEDQKRIDEVDEVHNNLNQLKSSCDDLKRKAQMKEKDIEKMRKEINTMTLAEEGFTQSDEQLQKRLKELDQLFQETKQKQLDAMMTKKTYEHMLQRMKKDRLIHQQRANTNEQLLNKNKLQLQSQAQQSQKVQEDNQKTTFALQGIIQGIEQQNQNRENNLNRFKDDLKYKQDIEQKREDRIKRSNEIAELAANEISDGNLKKWRKLLLVHKFLNQFLKLKMQREIKKFSGAEQSFQKIKAATGINDANEIVRKFLGREQTYSHLLISIAEYEKKIDLIKHENEELQKNFAKISDEQTKEEFEVSRDRDDNYSDQEKVLAEVEEKARLSKILMTKLTFWIERNLTKLQRGGLIEENQSFEQNSIAFLTILDILKTQLLTMSEEEQITLIDQQIKSEKQDLFEQEFQKRNVRVKPGQFAKQQKKSSYSNDGSQDSRIEEDFDDSQDDVSKIEEGIEGGIDEHNHLNQIRDQLRNKKKK